MLHALDRKLLRDLWRIRGQGLAIALIVASGVAMLVMSLSAMQALSDTSAAYYERYRFGHLFASVKRAPERLARSLADLRGVQLVETRIVEFASLRLAGFEEPVIGRLVSLPERGEPLVNALALVAGRLPEPDSQRQAVVAEAFAEAHGLRPGDAFEVLLNGRLRTLEVSGVALSPEYVYAIGPGALMPDPEHFGIVWLRRPALAAAYGLEGAFNDLSLVLAPDVVPEAVLASVDAQLARYGGIGSYARRDQISHWFLTNEIQQLATLARILPAIFLVVAAFLTNMVLARLVYLERAEIGLLKAFGYRHRAVVWHYAKLVVVLSVFGLLVGWICGFWLGHWLTGIYATVYRFPELIFQPAPGIFAISLLVSLVSSLLGVVGAARYAGALPPAEAMRPPQPPAFRHRRWAPAGLLGGFDQPTRIIFRQTLRRPLRSLLTALALAASVGLLVVSLQWLDALDYMVAGYFEDQQREDLVIGFREAVPLEAVDDAGRLPGVLAVEPARSASVRFEAGHRTHRGALSGLRPDAVLTVLRDAGGARVPLPTAGLLLSDTLASKLDVAVGERVRVALLEGTRARIDVPVSAVFETAIGMPAYLNLADLNRALDEDRSVNALQLVIDHNRRGELYAALQKLAPIGGVTLKAAAVDMFQETIAETMLVMVFVYLAFASTMAFGMVYNNLRIALSERGRELATLRVLGFRRGEISYMLFGEAALLVVVGLPLGCLLGWALALLMAASFDTELFRVPVVIEPSTYALAMLIALAAMLPSVLLMQRRLVRLDLIAVLKTRE